MGSSFVFGPSSWLTAFPLAADGAGMLATGPAGASAGEPGGRPRRTTRYTARWSAPVRSCARSPCGGGGGCDTQRPGRPVGCSAGQRGGTMRGRPAGPGAPRSLSRRDFLRRAGGAALAVPPLGAILAGSAKPGSLPEGTVLVPPARQNHLTKLPTYQEPIPPDTPIESEGRCRSTTGTTTCTSASCEPSRTST